MTGFRRSTIHKWHSVDIKICGDFALTAGAERSYHYERNLVADIGFEPMNVRVKVVCLTPGLIRNI